MAGVALRDPLEDERLKAETALADELYAYWAGQFKRVLAALRAERDALAAVQAARQASKEITLDWQAEEMLLTAQIGELLGQIVQGALEATAIAGVAVSWEIFDREAAALAQKYGYDLIKQISDSTRQQLGKLIGRWIETDADFEDLVADVRKLIPANPFPNVRDRARLIAATEVTRIYADARAANFTAAGLKRWRWRTAMDELVCPICRPLGLANNGEGAVGTIAGGFQAPDSELIVSRPPAHPGCRCWTVEDPVELEELVAQQSGQVITRPPVDEARRRFEEQIHGLSREAILPVNKLLAQVTAAWGRPLNVDADIILTGERRDHILARHPELAAYLGQLPDIISDPDEVQRNKWDPDMAIFYKRLTETHYLRVAVLIQHAGSHLHHSIISARLANRSEVERGRERRVWHKEEPPGGTATPT